MYKMSDLLLIGVPYIEIVYPTALNRCVNHEPNVAGMIYPINVIEVPILYNKIANQNTNT